MPKSAVAAFSVPLNVSTAKGVLTSDIVHYGVPGTVGEGLLISGDMNITAGAGTTALTIVCVRNAGPNAGGNVGPTSLTYTFNAGTSRNVNFIFLDAAPTPDSLPASPSGADAVGQNQYVITVAQVGGTAAGTMNYGVITVEPVATGW